MPTNSWPSSGAAASLFKLMASPSGQKIPSLFLAIMSSKNWFLLLIVFDFSFLLVINQRRPKTVLPQVALDLPAVLIDIRLCRPGPDYFHVVCQAQPAGKIGRDAARLFLR